ncbi:hypothetical protein [Pleomorphomonas sp. NRK KF1]|uniref:hypothetical protein n=1 Tax=Pleomorphomonas sp. NRK KF1 TaxID=2943000 RepID=UPI0020441AA0|nr:hypothetical protein [Pleomorphomonas sp. NRK KF1]MCM5552640.1 hypothetical protein [Pleomorphomonas sp. NRK KF1]
MTTTTWATVEGDFEEGDGQRRSARAELSPNGLAIIAPEGDVVALWRPVDLIRTMGTDGFRIGARRQAGIFVFDPERGADLIRALASIPDADAPMMSRSLVWTMIMVVALAISAMFVLGWSFFWLIEWFTARGVGTGTPG